MVASAVSVFFSFCFADEKYTSVIYNVNWYLIVKGYLVIMRSSGLSNLPFRVGISYLVKNKFNTKIHNILKKKVN